MPNCFRLYTSVCDTALAVRKLIAYESSRTLEYEIFMRTKISAITVDKEIVREVALGGQTPPEKICRSKITNQSGDRNERLPDFCFSICKFSQVVSIPRAQPHAQSLFLFPIVFGINLIHFFDEKRTVQSFVSVIQSPVTPFDRSKTLRRMIRTASKSAAFLATENVHSAPFRRGERGANFWQGKVQNSSPILRCTFLARKSAKPIANISAT